LIRTSDATDPHHSILQIELDDSWWVEAGMSDFVPYGRAYRVDGKAIGDQKVWEVRIEDIAPVRRSPGLGIFNINETATARERVVSILRDFRAGTPLYPIEIVDQALGGRRRFKLTHGVHRLYCSLAAGSEIFQPSP
jgi:hypothetical protein